MCFINNTTCALCISESCLSQKTTVSTSKGNHDSMFNIIKHTFMYKPAAVETFGLYCSGLYY